MTARAILIAALLAGALAPGAAFAQPTQVSDASKAAARQLTLDGNAALDRKDYAAAADMFRRADALYRAPTITLGLARAEAGLGKLVHAQEAYNRLVREPLAPGAPDVFVRAVEAGRAELAALAPRVPSIVIDVKGADGVKVTVDGVDVPSVLLGVKQPVDPGKHTVRAVARRFTPAETTVTVPEGKVETVNLELAPAPPGTPDVADAPAPTPPGPAGPAGAPPADTGGSGSGQKIAGFAALGVGGVGIVIGAVTMGLAASKHSSLLTQCPDGHCYSSQQSALQGDVNSYQLLGGLGVGGLVAGGALAATGAILLATAPKARARAAFVTPLVGPGFVGVGGRF